MDRGADETHGFFHVISQLYKTTMDLPPRIQSICWVQFWSWIGAYILFSIMKLKLMFGRLVSIPLLQHNMGRRDIFPLRKPRVRRKLLRHTGRRRSARQFVSCDIFWRHVPVLCTPPLRGPLTRQQLQKSKFHIPPSASHGSITASI